MYIYLVLMLFLLLCLIGMVVYVFCKTNIIIKNKIPNRLLRVFLSLIPIILMSIGFMIDLINTIVVYVHFFFIALFIELILLIVKKKRSVKPYLSLIISVIITTIWLGYGYYLAHHVVRTNYTIYTEKDLGVDNFRIVQITDSHIGSTMDGDLFASYIKQINNVDPDIAVITGDFIDDDTTYKDMVKSCQALGNLKTKYGVYFVYGNHDKGYYKYREFDEDKFREELFKNNVTILEDAYASIKNVVLIGRQDAQVKERLSAVDLTKNIDNSKYIIMLDHEPTDYNNEVLSNSDLVISGHTHGGQLIPLNIIDKIIKVNDNIYGLKKKGNTTFIVSSGIGDWAVKFKTGTKAEYVVIDIRNQHKS